MKSSALRILLLASPLLTRLAIAAQDGAQVQNWPAPPYWSPVSANLN